MRLNKSEKISKVYCKKIRCYVTFINSSVLYPNEFFKMPLPPFAEMFSHLDPLQRHVKTNVPIFAPLPSVVFIFLERVDLWSTMFFNVILLLYMCVDKMHRQKNHYVYRIFEQSQWTSEFCKILHTKSKKCRPF